MDFLAASLSNDELLTDLPQIASKDLLPLMSPTEPDPHNFSDIWNPRAGCLDDADTLNLPREKETDNYQIQNIGDLGERYSAAFCYVVLV